MFTAAVLITGGVERGTPQSAEIYHPERDSPCFLPDLPANRAYHTQDGSLPLLCGGSDKLRICWRWNPDTGTWDMATESLTKKRSSHISWTPGDGSETYLIGGSYSDRTSEIIDLENNVKSSFPLQHRIA